MTEGEKATVVLVHGAGGGPWIWESLGRELDARRIEHVEVDLPTMDQSGDRTADFHTDAAHVRAVLDGIEGPMVLCGNSYGGVVITEASAGHPGVQRLVYLAAVMPDVGEDVMNDLVSCGTPELMAGVVISPDGRAMGLDPEVAKKVVFQQASPEVADWAVTQMRLMSMGTGEAPALEAAGWHSIPSTYVVCNEDRSIRPEVQRRWADTRATDTIEVPFDHCPQLSHPKELADILALVAQVAPSSSRT
jgi:pimeloyl-ACP methyl ester carboxylesterase